jgi:hypothetical protein
MWREREREKERVPGARLHAAGSALSLRAICGLFPPPLSRSLSLPLSVSRLSFFPSLSLIILSLSHSWIQALLALEGIGERAPPPPPPAARRDKARKE